MGTAPPEAIGVVAFEAVWAKGGREGVAVQGVLSGCAGDGMCWLSGEGKRVFVDVSEVEGAARARLFGECAGVAAQCGVVVSGVPARGLAMLAAAGVAWQ